MITYDPFWKLMKKRKISQYDLEKKYGLNHYQLDRLRHNKPFSTETLNLLCETFDTDLSNIAKYEKDDKSCR